MSRGLEHSDNYHRQQLNSIFFLINIVFAIRLRKGLAIKVKYLQVLYNLNTVYSPVPPGTLWITGKT